ncbi:MAG: hypothetical protein HUK12_10810, partial [Muribaculaceae bacterium]|nr:hypothetical protein [Muribaculaceae bacterium]
MNNYAAKLDGPDFNYPKNVISEAEIGLQNALKAQNGNDVVKCLVQYGIAQSLISDDNMPEILKKIDGTIASDNNADSRALLFYFKGLAIDSYSGNFARSRKNAVNSEISSDPSEWDTKQCATLTAECCKKALEEARNARSKKIGEYPDVIINADDVSARLCPTLFDFIAYKSIKLVDNENDKKQLLNEWKQANIDNEDVTIFIECENKDKSTSWKDIYNNHKNNDLSGYALRHLERNLENYPLFMEYATKFPAGAFVDDIQNNIAEIKKKTTIFHFKNNFTSADSITVSANVNNVNNLTATIYKVPDNLSSRDRYDTLLLSQLKPVATKEVVVEGEIPFQKRIDIKFPPLPYGKYVALADFEGREKNIALDEGKYGFVEKVTIDDYFVVSDIALFSSCTDQDSKKHKVFAVNFITGKP